jgi:hypothetical protein
MNTLLRVSFLIVLTFMALINSSCTYDSENDFISAPNGDDPNATVNYVNDIKPIIDGNCIGCHASPPVNGAPFALINYNQVNQRSNGIFNAMNRSNGSSGVMPPSGRLPQATIDLIQEWIDGGTPEN